MTTVPISLQDLTRRLYGKAKAEKDWRCWGLYVPVTKLETLRTAYAVAKKHNGAPGLDGVTCAAIEGAGVELFLAELRDALVSRTYRPLRNRHVAIPKDGGTVRVLGIPAIRDRVVQGALTLILERAVCNGSGPAGESPVAASTRGCRVVIPDLRGGRPFLGKAQA